MAESRRYGLGDQPDMEQVHIEAQHRWLRPAEICEILRNYMKFHIAPQPANVPESGSLFLFDRKVLRYFRKDGHNWRKRNGKIEKEAHERLKVGGSYVLVCYYAYGEENENFQRRSYWMLDEDLSHIVLVHYREVKGNRTTLNRIRETEEAIPNSQETEDLLPNFENDSYASCSIHPNNTQVPSQTTDTTSLNSAQASEYKDAESAYNQQARFGFHSFQDLQQSMVEKTNTGLTDPQFPASVSNDYQGKSSAISGVDFVLVTQADKAKESNNAGLKDLDFDVVSWEDILNNASPGSQTMPLQPQFLERQPDTIGVLGKRKNQKLGQLFTSNFGERQEFGGHPQAQEEWKTSEDKCPLDQDVHMESVYGVVSRLPEAEQDVNQVNVLNCLEPCLALTDKQENFPMQDNLQGQLTNAEHSYYLDLGQESKVTLEGKTNKFFTKQPLLDGSLAEEGLKQLDSFNRCMSNFWDGVEGESRVDESSISPQVHWDNYTLGPTLSQDQLFSIIDFSPNWAYEGSEIKVLIIGRFLKNQQEAENCEWSCMFGEVEVPAEVIADGVLRCHTPIHKAARVPFYVTRSNRLACSEVREFEFRFKPVKDADIIDNYWAYSASNGIYPAWPPPCKDHEITKVCTKCMCRDYEPDVVFKKLLPSDVQGSGGNMLYIPKPHAARFCSPANISGSEVITFCDNQMKPWPMDFRTIDGRAYLGAGWSKFVGEKALRAGDTVIFYEVRCGQRASFFMITVSYKDRLQILGAPINYTN